MITRNFIPTTIKTSEYEEIYLSKLFLLVIDTSLFFLLSVNKVKWFHVLRCTTNNSINHQSFTYTYLKDQTVLILIIEFSRSHLFAFSWNVKQFYLIYWYDPYRWYLSGQSGPESNGNKGIFCISQNSRNTGASPSDCLILYLGFSCGCLTLLQRCRWCIFQPQPSELFFLRIRDTIHSKKLPFHLNSFSVK